MSSVSLDTISSQAANLCNYIYEGLYSLASRVANLFKDLTDWISSWFTDQNKQIELKKPVTSSTVAISPEKTEIPTKMFLDFYRGTGTDIKGRTLDEILIFDSKALEATHDFIQWLFPNWEQGEHNAQGPTLNDEIVQAFKEEKILQENLANSFLIMINFYGFVLANGKDVDIDATVDDILNHNIGTMFKANDAKLEWLKKPHNFLRLTRILICLSSLGFPDLAQSLLDRLKSVASKEGKGAISNKTLAFWESTVGAI